jgi:UDP-GlcNAc:undecaprenyl-phosphate GlcNAc-1-phosphate transferase
VSFPLNVYTAAALSGCIISALAMPPWRRWCLRTGHIDEPGHRKIHEQPIPLAGGLAVATGLLIPAVLASLLLCWPEARQWLHTSLQGATPGDPAFLLKHGLERRALELTGILAGAIGMLALGWLDDQRELRPKPKFIGQFLVAFLVAASGARITLFVPNVVFHYAVTIFWILTVVNAFNFMDNMNGLCTGLGAIGAWYFATIAAAQGQYLVGLIAFLAFGALAGFLPYNFPRARAFLGDAGSHLVGYLLAVLAVLPHFYTSHRPRHLAVLIPLLVLAVPLFDMGWVVILRWRIGQPFYVGDTNHLSHRLVRAGLTRTQSVLVIWAIAVAIGALSYLLL